GGGHALVPVVGGDAGEQFALGRLAGDEDAFRTLGGVEPQAGLALGPVGAVAVEAGVGEDRPDVAVEGERGRPGGGGARLLGGGQGAREQENGQAGGGASGHERHLWRGGEQRRVREEGASRKG